MKKTLILAAMAVVAAAPTFAAKAKPAAKTPSEVHCAIMKTNKVNVASATKTKMYADYKGNRYFFCCAGCPEAFKKEPAKYAKADHIPTPKK